MCDIFTLTSSFFLLLLKVSCDNILQNTQFLSKSFYLRIRTFTCFSYGLGMIYSAKYLIAHLILLTAMLNSIPSHNI